MTNEVTEAAAAPLTEVESVELDALRTEMGDHNGRSFDGHWSDHYWHNETKQARALELIDREARGVALPPRADAEPAGQGEGVLLADRAQGAEAAAAHGLSADSWQVGQDIAGDLDAAFGDTAAEINQSLMGLPDTLRSGMLRELSSPYVPQQPEADRKDVETFEKTRHGAICVEKWGSATARRLAIALHRCQRFEDALGADDLAEWKGWLHGLQPSEKAAVLGRLSS